MTSREKLGAIVLGAEDRQRLRYRAIRFALLGLAIGAALGWIAGRVG